MRKDRLVLENLGFAYQQAYLFPSSAPLEDRQQAACLGLVMAAQRFDGRPGVKFISYARWWVRKALVASLFDSLPVTVTSYAFRNDERAAVRAVDVQHLDEFVDEKGRTRAVDRVEDAGPSPLEVLELKDNRSLVMDLLDSLTEVQRTVIVRRFGLEGKAWKLEDVGRHLGVCRERVRQIQNDAIRAMRVAAYRRSVH